MASVVFAQRTERDKSLQAFHLAAYGTGDDFRYGHGPAEDGWA